MWSHDNGNSKHDTTANSSMLHVSKMSSIIQHIVAVKTETFLTLLPM